MGGWMGVCEVNGCMRVCVTCVGEVVMGGCLIRPWQMNRSMAGRTDTGSR